MNCVLKCVANNPGLIIEPWPQEKSCHRRHRAFLFVALDKNPSNRDEIAHRNAKNRLNTCLSHSKQNKPPYFIKTNAVIY